MRKYLLQTFLILCISFAPIGQGFSAGMQEMGDMPESCLDGMSDMEHSEKTCDSDECFQHICLSSGSGFSYVATNKLVIVNNLSFDYWIRYLDHLETSMPSRIYRPPTI